MRTTIAIYGPKDIGKEISNVHDHNICIMKDGVVKQYLHLERYSRKKFDNRLDYYLEELFENGVLEIEDDFDIVFVNSLVSNAFQSKNGLLKFESAKIFPTPPQLVSDCYALLGLGNYKVVDAYMLSHELAHIYTNTIHYGEIKENSLLIHYDGGASVSNFSAFHLLNGEVKHLENHWDFLPFSSFFNNNILCSILLENHHFNTNQELSKYNGSLSLAGKLMGYSSYGKYSLKIEQWLIQNNYFNRNHLNINEFLKDLNGYFNVDVKSIDNKAQIFKDIIATLHHIFERTFIEKIKELKEKTKADYLYYSGGSALNIKLNSKLLDLKLFKDIFIPPACGDSGLSLGAAAFVENIKHNKIKKHSPYLNNIYSDIDEWSFDEKLIDEAVNFILQGKIIGLAYGNAEAGPRALGHRSILGRPDNTELSKYVSQTIKNREWYRPIAPVMLKEVAEMVTGKNIHHLGKYMLLELDILPQYKNQLEGVIHIDGTSRIQIIETIDDNQFLYKLLKTLFEKHNILGLINTSFNRSGEPIVHTYKDAITSASNMNLDAVIINGEIITKYE